MHKLLNCFFMRRAKAGKMVSPTRALVLGFFIIIIVGALLLALPISSREGQWTNLLTTMFTATSATCVTGLILVDTYTYWSVFGQAVILLLIQIGGLGFMSMATLFSFLMRRTITLRERMVMTTSLNVRDMSGIVRLTKRVLLGTLLFEGVGAVTLSIRFISEFGVADGIRKGVFHAVSAFCNAGFDLMGGIEPFSSLTRYADDPVINITIMLLIIIGGLGFYVWNDVYEQRSFRHLHLHTRLVLLTTVVLVLVGALLTGIWEWNNPKTLGALPAAARPLAALFQSVTLRTAGFCTVDQAALTGPSKLIGMIWMFIGGSPGSTAGGIKTVSLAVLLLTAVSAVRGRSRVSVYGRTISTRSIINAVTMLVVGVVLVLSGTMILLAFDNVPLTAGLYEVVSAFGTVGLSMNLTPTLSAVSQITLMILMFLGRVGVLTLGVAVLMGRHRETKLYYPEAQVFVG